MYEYDFGDGWLHELRCEELVESDVQTPYAVCIAGARACPPEDCGGPDGYADLLRVLEDKQHPEHDETRAWAGRRFNPEAFAVDYATAELGRLFRRKKAN